MHTASAPTSPVWVAGVDGCRGGWLMFLLALTEPPAWQACLYASFEEVLHAPPYPQVIAVDMPIGLLDVPAPGGRRCDQEARRLLGRRSRSIFSPPSRLSLGATHYDEVRGQGMSRQSFGLLPKIRELDQLLTPASQQRVYEAHPELAFCRLAKHPLHSSKKTAAGYAERCQLLSSLPVFPMLRDPYRNSGFRRTQVALDDFVDAAVLSWVAYGIACGQARRVPCYPACDRRGLRMEIWFCDS